MSLAASSAAVTDLGALATLRMQARDQDPDSLRAAAQQFEALFVQQVLKSARGASLGEDLLGGPQSDVYRDLFDQQMALHLSTAGGGIGLAEVLVRQMQPQAPATPLATPEGEAGVSVGAAAGWNPLPPRTANHLAVRGAAPALEAPGAARHARPASAEPVRQPAQAMMPAMSARAVTGPQGANGAQDAQGAADSPDAFIAQIRPHAEAAAARLGVPAEAIMAQAALETGWGQFVPRHADGGSSFNYFGIKAHGQWDGARLVRTTHEHLGGRMRTVAAEFRAYDSPAAAFSDYADFLQSNPRYTDALRMGREDAGAYVRGLQQAGYATDPAYAHKLLKLIDRVSITPTEAPAVGGEAG